MARASIRVQQWIRKMVVAAVLVALVGWSGAQSEPCGDLDADGFVAGAGCVTSEDCNDQDRSVYPGAVEVCNGHDDDCDGSLDEGCARECRNFEVVDRVLLRAGSQRARIAAAPRGWVMDLRDGSYDAPRAVSRFDTRGERLVPWTVYETDYPRKGSADLVWTGAEIVAGWNGESTRSQQPGVFLRRFDAWAHAQGDRATITDSKAGLVFLAWIGDELSVFWSGLDYGLRLTRLDKNADSLGPDKWVASIKGRAGSRMTWNGDGYGWVYRQQDAVTGHLELFFQPLTRFGDLAGAAKRITDHSAFPADTFASRPEIVFMGGDRGYGLLWMDDRTEKRQIWFALLDPDGSLRVPPGEVQVSFVEEVRPESALIWNGHEFLASWVDQSVQEELMASRISAEGEVLETRSLVQAIGLYPELAWDGSGYGVVYSDGASTPTGSTFLRLGCACQTDADGDGVLPCGGGDCDDGDPERAPDQVEICDDRKDNDCNGLADCNDPACAEPGFPPPETFGVSFAADKQTLSWQASPAVTEHDVARGDVGDVLALGSFDWVECLASRIEGTSWVDPLAPPVGHGWYYLVRGRRSACVLATWGSPLRDDTLHGCP